MELTGNTFIGGLNKDFNPIATPNDVLTDALNATLITFNGNELMLLNDMGNTNLTYYPRTYEAMTSENNNDIDYKETVSKIREKVKLKEGYIPIGIKEHGDIIYIVSYNPEEERTEIGSFPGPEYRPFDKIASKEVSKFININNDTLNTIYNLTEEGDALLKPYDLISDYSMEGLSPMFISTQYNKGLYIPKYINVNTNQDITDSINITYTYKTAHLWSNKEILTLYNYKLSKNLYDVLKDKLELQYPYSYYIHHPELKEEEYSKIEEYYNIQTVEYTYKDNEYVLLLTFENIFDKFDIESIIKNNNLSNYVLLELKNDDKNYNAFISYPNIKKGDIGVSYILEDINGIVYINNTTGYNNKNFNYYDYIPEIILDEDVVYNNVIINTSDDYNNKSCYISNEFKAYNIKFTGGKELYEGSPEILFLIKSEDKTEEKESFNTEGKYVVVEDKIFLYLSDDIVYVYLDDYNKIKKITYNNYEIIEKIITLDVNNIKLLVPALLYREINK